MEGNDSLIGLLFLLNRKNYAEDNVSFMMSIVNVISLILAFVLAIAAILQIWTQTSFSLFFRAETRSNALGGCPVELSRFGINMTISSNYYLDFIIGNGGPGVARNVKLRMKMIVPGLNTNCFERDIPVIPPKAEIPFYGCIEIRRDWNNGNGAIFLASLDTRFLKLFRVSRTFQFDFKGEIIGFNKCFTKSLFSNMTNKFILIQKVLRLKYFAKSLCFTLTKLNK